MPDSNGFIPCQLKRLPAHLAVAAANTAREMNPANGPAMDGLLQLLGSLANRLGEPDEHVVLTPERIAAVTTLVWKNGGVHLTVGFMDNPPADLRARILSHMNAWNKTGNVEFVESKVDPQVRIARQPDGYWSYLGVEVLSIPRNQQTMNLEGFTMNTPESEFHRVVRHETGHTLGFPHEHMRRELTVRLDVAKTIIYFQQTQGWSAREVREQVLTPLDPRTLTATAHADQDSIMCYQLPGTITIDGQPIRGGDDIDDADYAFCGKLYPKPSAPPPVEPPPVIVTPGGEGSLQVEMVSALGHRWKGVLTPVQ